jgi:outer membrane protein
MTWPDNTKRRPRLLPFAMSMLALSAWASSGDSQDAQPAMELTLNEAILIAVDQNPDVRLAALRIAEAEALVAEGDSTLWPVLRADASYLHADAPSAFLFKTIDARTFVEGTDFNNPGTFHNIETGLSLSYPLYNGGQDRGARKIAKTGMAISQQDKLAVQNQLVADVIRTFYRVRTAADLVTTADASVKTVSAQLNQTRTKYEAGGALKSDLLSLQVRLAEAEEQRIRANNGRLLATSVLAHLLGSSVATELTISDDDWSPGELPQDFEAGLGEAFAGRPELTGTRYAIDRAQLAVSAAKGAYAPRVDVIGRVYDDGSDLSYSMDTLNWTAGVALSWDIFDGGSRNARLDKSRTAAETMLETDRKTALAIELDVKTAYLRFDEAKARTVVADASIAQAEESLTLVRTQFKGGTATVTRYLEAELMLTQARMRQTTSRYDSKNAQADIARALGRLAVPSGKDGAK